MTHLDTTEPQIPHWMFLFEWKNGCQLVIPSRVCYSDSCVPWYWYPMYFLVQTEKHAQSKSQNRFLLDIF